MDERRGLTGSKCLLHSQSCLDEEGMEEAGKTDLASVAIHRGEDVERSVRRERFAAPS